MNKLPSIITHPELIETIIGQFAFMKMMAKPEDRNFYALNELDLNDVFRKADSFFIEYCTFEEAIEMDELEEEFSTTIALFLSEWKAIVDVTAIQQNVHHRLATIDSE